MNLDEALTALGAFGRFQILVYLAISVFDNLPSIMHMSIMTFIGYEPVYQCKVRPDDGCSLANCSTNSTLAEPEEVDGGWVADKCHLYRNISTGSTGNWSEERVSCPYGWNYSPTPVETSIVTDWDLVCDRNVLPETSQMVFNFGVMFGAILFGFLSDKFGRKKSFIFALVTQAIVGCATAIATNFYVFTILRFIVGALEQGINITGFIMATELFPPKERTIAAVSHEFLWALGGAILPGWAYLFRQWRHLQIAVSLPTILGILLIWTIPESLVWLIAKGRTTEAEKILERAARMNGRQLPAKCLSNDVIETEIKNCDVGEDRGQQSAAAGQKTYTVIDLVRTPNMRKITICISALWNVALYVNVKSHCFRNSCTRNMIFEMWTQRRRWRFCSYFFGIYIPFSKALNTMVYYGLSLNTPNLYGDMYLNFFIGQMVEIPSVIATMWFIYKVGRRWPLCLFHVFGGLVCIASPFVPAQTAGGFDLTWVSVTLAMLGKFAINASFSIIYIYGPEIYPTVLRNTGAGMGSFAGRFGGILYPYINYLSKMESAGSISRQLPLVIFGVLSIAGGFLALPLPETRNRPLPETIDDLENYEEFCRRHRVASGNVNGDTSKGDNVELRDLQS